MSFEIFIFDIYDLVSKEAIRFIENGSLTSTIANPFISTLLTYAFALSSERTILYAPPKSTVPKTDGDVGSVTSMEYIPSSIFTIKSFLLSFDNARSYTVVFVSNLPIIDNDFGLVISTIATPFVPSAIYAFVSSLDKTTLYASPPVFIFPKIVGFVASVTSATTSPSLLFII